jgi:Tfp pilus assembly protein PilN
MKAINLIPAEQRRGAGGIAGRTGGLVYVLIATLLVLVGLGVLYVSAAHTVATRKATLVEVTGQAGVLESQVEALQPYVSFAGVSQQRVEGVASLAYQRFDWPDAMEQLALSLPKGVWLSSLSGAATGGGSSQASSATGSTGTTGASAPLATTIDAPTLSLTGCAPSQDAVAATLANLRKLHYVDNAQVSTYAKAGCPQVGFTMTADYSNAYAIPSPKIGAGANSTVGG